MKPLEITVDRKWISGCVPKDDEPGLYLVATAKNVVIYNPLETSWGRETIFFAYWSPSKKAWKNLCKESFHMGWARAIAAYMKIEEAPDEFFSLEHMPTGFREDRVKVINESLL